MKTKISAAILVLMSIIGYTQDLRFSQFYTSSMTLNPALTGRLGEFYQIHLQYRNQWVSALSNPYVTQNIAYDMPIPDSKFGAGCYLLNYHAGAGSLNSLHFMASSAYEIMQDPLNQHHLMTGLQLGFIQKSISYDELTFDNQYTTLNGGGFDKNSSTGEYFNGTTKFMLDANFGVHYYNIDKYSIFSKNVSQFGYIKPYYAGFSMFHLFEPNESFFSSGDAPIPRRFVLYGGMMWRITPEIYAEPMLMTQWQAWHNEFVFGGLFYYYMRRSDSHFYSGLLWRAGDALLLHSGIDVGRFKVGFAYDFGVFSLEDIPVHKGAFEFYITVIPKQENKFTVPKFL